MGNFSILDNTHIDQIVDLGSGVFENVTASTVVLNIKNQPTLNNSKIITAINNIEKHDFSISVIDQSQYRENISYAFNIYMGPKEINISKRIRHRGSKLCEYYIDNIEGIVAHKHLISVRP